MLLFLCITEAVQEEKSPESSQVHANGTTTTAHSVHLNDSPEDSGGFLPTHNPQHQETMMIQTNNNGTIITEAEMAPNPHRPPFGEYHWKRETHSHIGKGNMTTYL